jgi:TonB family protein
MRRLLLALLFCWPCVSAQQTYSPPEVTSAGDAYAPYNFVFDGFFVVDVGIGDDGSIGRIEALRNPGAMLGEVESMVQNWKFRPATKGGKARASRMTVAFVYRPPNYPTFGAVPVKDFTPVLPSARSDEGSGDNVPAGIMSFAYADYPVNSVASGSVVLQATVDNEGNVKNVDVLHGMAGFNRFAQGALKNWRFRAATLHGRPVVSKIAVAFLFQPPPSAD